MARFRISRLAQSDVERILETSQERWGVATRERYAALVVEALRAIAGDPQGSSSKDRSDLMVGLRSFHLRRATAGSVGAPVHVVYYRMHRSGSVDVVRVLHERMDPQLQLDATPSPVKARRRPR
jgi:toxin ParE1/3/4